MVNMRILIDGDVVLTREVQTLSSVEPVPAGSEIAVVQGIESEPAAAKFMQQLRLVSTAIGYNADTVRKEVVQNAEALRQAVEQMKEADGKSAFWAAQNQRLLDETEAAAPGATDAPNPGTKPAAPPSGYEPVASRRTSSGAY